MSAPTAAQIAQLCDKPLRPPPPGWETDFSRPGFADATRILCIVLVILNTLFTAARVYTRGRVLKAFSWDDAFCVISWMTTTVEIALTITVTRYGFGKHIWDVRTCDSIGLYRTLFVISTFSDWTYMPLKLAYFFTFLRIFSPMKLGRWMIIGGAVVSTTFYFAAFWYEIFKCDPIAKSWSPFLQGKCLSTFVPGALTGIFNVISDVYILVLPIPMVMKLQTTLKKKIQLIAIFSVGGFVTATSIVRLVQTIMQSNNYDTTYTIGRVAIWANLEFSVGLMVVNTMVFPAFWGRVLREPLVHYWNQISSAGRSLVSFRSTTSSGREPRSSTSSKQDEVQLTTVASANKQETERQYSA